MKDVDSHQYLVFEFRLDAGCHSSLYNFLPIEQSVSSGPVVLKGLDILLNLKYSDNFLVVRTVDGVFSYFVYLEPALVKDANPFNEPTKVHDIFVRV